MQITLEQAEIEVAVQNYIKDQGLSFEADPNISFTAGRGSTGITAAIDLTCSSVNFGPGTIEKLPNKEKDTKAFTEPVLEKPVKAVAPKKKKTTPKKRTEPLAALEEEKEVTVEETESVDPFEEGPQEVSPAEVTENTLFAS